jgi:hypothetical protein
LLKSNFILELIDVSLQDASTWIDYLVSSVMFLAKKSNEVPGAFGLGSYIGISFAIMSNDVFDSEVPFFMSGRRLMPTVLTLPQIRESSISF